MNLADNALTEVPVETLRTLRILSSLDLTNNRVQYVPNNAFVTLRWIWNLECYILSTEYVLCNVKKPRRLNTLKFSDNNITLAEGAFNGLEQSLKNLNLKVHTMLTIMTKRTLFTKSIFLLKTCRAASCPGCREL